MITRSRAAAAAANTVENVSGTRSVSSRATKSSKVSSVRTAERRRQLLDLKIEQKEEEAALERQLHALRHNNRVARVDFEKNLLQAECDESSVDATIPRNKSTATTPSRVYDDDIRPPNTYVEHIYPVCDPLLNNFNINSQVPPVSPVRERFLCDVNNSAPAETSALIDYLQLPQLEIVKFNGNPTEYNKFYGKFNFLVLSKNLPEFVKLSRLMQFLGGRALEAVKDYEGVEGGLSTALEILKERFGQPFLIVDACIRSIADGPLISSTDADKYQALADKLVSVRCTLESINSTHEITTDHLKRILRRLPVGDQAKWRAVASGSVVRPGLNELVALVRKRAAALNDPIYGLTKTALPVEKGYAGKPRQSSSSFVTDARQMTPLQSHHNAEENYGGKTRQSSSSFVANASATPTWKNNADRKCDYCKNSDHYISRCDTFIALDAPAKRKYIQENKLCRNCLKTKHFAEQCTSSGRCRQSDCGKKHHTLLHGVFTTVGSDPAKHTGSPSSTTISHYTSGNVASHLQIVPVRVYGRHNSCCTTYALIDSGSNGTYICDSLAKKLDLVGESVHVDVTTLSGVNSVSGHRVDFALSNESASGAQVDVTSALMVKHLNVGNVPLPSQQNFNKWPHLRDLNIPDLKEKSVQLLIGTDVPIVFVQDDFRVGNPSDPIAVHCILGWTVLGPTKAKHRPYSFFACSVEDQFHQHILEEFVQVEKFCLTDTPIAAMSVNDRYAEKVLEEKTYKQDGKYVVPMLWGPQQVVLPNNKKMAEIRLESTKRKLQNNPDLYEKYRAVMDGYVSSGYAREVDFEADKGSHWYLPHHPVTNVNKPGKLRVVFDAAAKFQGHALNKHLLKGPQLTNTLIGVLLRFRQCAIAIVADIEKMFHQVRVLPADSKNLCYLWWKNDLDERPATFQMVVHIFGAASSPCCASYAIKRTISDNKRAFSEETISAAGRGFYVDDLLRSVPTVPEAQKLVHELRELLQLGGFNLTKWLSNSPEVLKDLPEEHLAPQAQSKNLELANDEATRALGIQWTKTADQFGFKVQTKGQPNTKRGVLSMVGSLFDPLGFLSPVLLKPKHILQQLWKFKCGWDDVLPQELISEWETWLNQLSQVELIKIPRCYCDSFKSVELHMFADASEIGYGCVAFLRFSTEFDTFFVSFVFGKSRVTPIKSISIPRLELQAATLAVRVASMLSDELEYQIMRCVYWTDSMTVLGYINNQTARYHTFVANRLAEIHDSTIPSDWRYCRSELNPADDASRGLAASEINNNSRWLNGPPFLCKTEIEWPIQERSEVFEEDPEVKQLDVVCRTQVAEVNSILSLINRYSSLLRLRKALAWINRFMIFIRNRKQCETTSLSLPELLQSDRLAAITIQRAAYAAEIKQHNKEGTVPASSSLRSLCPIMEDGILKVGGRLDNSTLSESAKHPIILPANENFSRVVVRHFHESNAHCGVESTLANTRERFWIVGCRKLAKEVVAKCVVCKRHNQKLSTQVMAPLPTERLVPYDPPFTRCGVDYFGPIEVVFGRKTVKRYGCLFTCFNTRAIHLELSPSLSADDFINTLRQFLNRRGAVQEIWSDNGTNFVGAEKEIRDAIDDWNSGVIEEALKQREITWRFQTPLASHMSGVWERMIGLVKKHLKALCGTRSLDEHRVRTLFSEVEYVVNSRPLTMSSDDPKDLEALTPNHFLMIRNCSTPPFSALSDNGLWSRRRWKQIQHLSDQFWKRWLNDYIPTLQKRTKWSKPQRNLQVGDLVLSAGENAVRNKWPLARVTAVYPGKDGFVRSASVKMATGVYTRPISKLCLLEAVD
jgi:hypothetical protein